jgi:hypothetical protein
MGRSPLLPAGAGRLVASSLRGRRRARMGRSLIAAAIAAATGADKARTAEVGCSGRCEAGGRRPAGAGKTAESVLVHAAGAVRVAGSL